MQFDCLVRMCEDKIGATSLPTNILVRWFDFSSFALIFRHHFCRRFPSDSFRNFHSNFVLIIFRLLSSKKIYQLTQSFERIAFFPLSFYLCIVRRWVGTKFAIQKSSLSRQALALWLLALVLIYCLQPLWLESNHLISKCSV